MVAKRSHAARANGREEEQGNEEGDEKEAKSEANNVRGGGREARTYGLGVELFRDDIWDQITLNRFQARFGV